MVAPLSPHPYAYVERWARGLKADSRSLKLVVCAVCAHKFFLPARDAAAGGRRAWYCGPECFNSVRKDYRNKAVRKGRTGSRKQPTEVTNG